MCSYFTCMCAGLQGDEGSYESWGSSACPCVEKVQGSSLLPVREARKITLLARNLHLYQVQRAHTCTDTVSRTHTHTHRLCLSLSKLSIKPKVFLCLGLRTELRVCVGHRRTDGGGGRLH